MALSTNGSIQDFDGTGWQTAINATGGAQDVADGAYSPASGATHSEIDNSTTKAALAIVVLRAKDGFSATPDGGSISVHVRGKEVDGDVGHHDAALDAGYLGGYRGDLLIDKATAVQYPWTVISVLGLQKFELALANDCGATLLDDASGWDVRVMLLGLVPKPA